MPLWKKTTTICAALLIWVPVGSESMAQRRSPLTPLPLANVSSGTDNIEGMFFHKDSISVKSPAPRKNRIYSPLKPMKEPSAPIVKLATRPVFELSPPAKPAPSIRQIPAHKINQAELGRLLAISETPSDKAEKLSVPALTQVADSKSILEVQMPVASTAKLRSAMLTPLPSSALVATSKTAVGLTNDFPLAATTPSVVVRSPFVQPGNPNRYLFVVENIGTVDAVSTRVELRVPAGVVLKQVVADSASSTARHAIVRIEDLKAGAKSILEVEIEPTTVDVTFDTSLTLETKRSFHGLTLPEENLAGVASPATPSASAAVSTGTSLVSFNNTKSIDTSPVTAGVGNVSAAVEGPVLLSTGQMGDFSIVVKNPNYAAASNIVVQLAIPQGLKITTLDREAWINDEDNTISWEIFSLGARQEEVIQYKAVGKSFGQQIQKVTIGMSDVYQGDAKLVTLVSQ